MASPAASIPRCDSALAGCFVSRRGGFRLARYWFSAGIPGRVFAYGSYGAASSAHDRSSPSAFARGPVPAIPARSSAKLHQNCFGFDSARPFGPTIWTFDYGTNFLVLVGWHMPAAYALGLRSEFWHEIEHVSFFGAGLLFWWPVISPWPSVWRHSRWFIVPYLFLATLPCDALSAYLAFCDRVVYSWYLTAPRLVNMSALQDQECAGALMWVFVTFAYLVPAVFLTTKLLSGSAGHETQLSSGDLPETIDAPVASKLHGL